MFVPFSSFDKEKVIETLTSSQFSTGWVERNGIITIHIENVNKTYKFTSWGVNYSGSKWLDYAYVRFYNSTGEMKLELYATNGTNGVVSEEPFVVEMNAGDYIQVQYQLSNNTGKCNVYLNLIAFDT